MSAVLTDAITEYLDSRRARGIKKATVINEKVVLGQFLAANGNLLVKNLTSVHVDRYFTSRPGLAASTWNRNTAYLRGFFKWCRARRYVPKDFDPLEGVSLRKVVPRDFIFLPVDRFIQLLDSAKNPRDRAVCALGLYSFQRASELNRLTWDDIDDTHADPKQWRIAVYRQKTEDRDWLPLCQELRDELHRWRLAYGASVGEVPRGHWYVVPAFKPGNWTQDENRRLALASPLELNPTRRYSQPQKAVQHALSMMGYTTTKHEGAHTLRRSGGYALYQELAWERGHDGALRIVQSMYGHASLATTERYLRLTLERKRRNDMLAGGQMFPSREGKVVEIAKGDTRSASL